MSQRQRFSQNAAHPHGWDDLALSVAKKLRIRRDTEGRIYAHDIQTGEYRPVKLIRVQR